MRIITGKGQIVREYILTAPEGTIILPERGLDLEEQAAFLKQKLSEGFNGDIVTFSPWIVCDTPTGSVYTINENLELVKNTDHKFGDSADMSSMVVMRRQKSCSNLALEKINEIKEDVLQIKTKEDVSNVLNKLQTIGSSFERMGVINILKTNPFIYTIEENHFLQVVDEFSIDMEIEKYLN